MEFLVQGLQLRHGENHPELYEGNTLTAIEKLRELAIMPDDTAEQLRADYLFLRRIEHYLQIFEDRQIHALPTDPEDLGVFARRLHGIDATAEDFQQELEQCLQRVNQTYNTYLAPL